MLRVARAPDIIGMAGLEAGNSRQLKAFHDSAYHSFTQIGSSLPKGQFPRVVDRQPMAEIKVGITAFGCQIVGISWKGPVTGSGVERIAAVINRVRPRVSGLDLESLGEALGHCGLESVIIGICNRAV